MTDFDKLTDAISGFAGMQKEEFELSALFWQQRDYKKGDFYNQHRSVCKYLGFVINGAFRSYIIDEKAGEEKNVFLV